MIRALNLYSEHSSSKSQLYNTIKSGKFFDLKLSDEDIIDLIKGEFEADFDRLSGLPSDQVLSPKSPSSESPSRSLYGADDDRVNRIFKSILGLRYLQQRRWDKWRYSWDRGSIVYPLIILLIATTLVENSPLLRDEPVKSLTHNEKPLRAINGEFGDIAPCFERLNYSDRCDIILALQIDLNGPSNSNGGIPAFRLHFMFGILRCVSRTLDQPYDKTLTEQNLQCYDTMYDMYMRVATRRISPETGP